MLKDDKYFIGGYSLVNMRNRNEIRVIEAMREILPETPEFCGCDICLEDVYGATLNSLKPRYKHHMTIVLKDNEVTDENIAEKVKEIIKKVSGNPNHPK
ncbi:late competence development ComFB family protein [candidate division KSB1 bacterium]